VQLGDHHTTCEVLLGCFAAGEGNLLHKIDGTTRKEFQQATERSLLKDAQNV